VFCYFDVSCVYLKEDELLQLLIFSPVVEEAKDVKPSAKPGKGNPIEKDSTTV